MLSVSLLGDFRLSYNETPVTEVNTPRLQSLIAYLILHRDAPQSRRHLAFVFWPDTHEAQARTNLRNLLHQLRQVLTASDDYLSIDWQTLQWRPDGPFGLDVIDFEAALADADRSQKGCDLAAEKTELEKAVAIYKGDLLPGCYDDWIIPQREGLRQAYLSALERLVWILEQQRDYPGAIKYAQCLLRNDPLHEATYRCLMRLHALSGDRAGGLRVYHTCATVLHRELEVEPALATQEAYNLLLGAESRPSPSTVNISGYSTLVGREGDWAKVLQAWRKIVTEGGPHALLLCGEAGIGKTRLVEELLQWASRQGISCATTKCYAAEGNLAYAPAVAWLRAYPLAPLDDVWLAEIARLLPEVLIVRPNLPRPTSLTEAWQRQQLFEALSRAILGITQPLLLTIDDLQWCDRDTLEWLHFLLRFDRKARLLVVGAYRPEEIQESHPILPTLQALRLNGKVTEIELDALSANATRTLASQLAGREIGIDNAKLLFSQTEGNPLFVVETVRAGLPINGTKVGGWPYAHALGGGTGLPPKIKSVIEARLSQLSTPARQLAALAATIGREFSFNLLVKTSGQNEDTLVRELDELWQRRIIREHGADGYDFSHDKLREVAYEGMSEARRQLLHRRVAQGLEKIHASNLNLISHQVAAHYEHAGLLDKAIPYYFRAARVAREVYANEEAITLLHRAITLVEACDLDPIAGEGKAGLTAQLWEELGDVLELKAQHDEALQALQHALKWMAGTDHVWLARLHCKRSIVLREQRLYAEALHSCQQAEELLCEQPDEKNDLWWDQWLEAQVERVWAHYWLAQWPEMEALVNKLSPVVQDRGKGFSRMRVLMASSLLHLRKERYRVSDEMLADTREALAASLEWGSLKNKVECQFEVGFLHLWRHELDLAEENLQVALQNTQTYGIVPLQTLSLTYLTVLNRFKHQREEVLKYALRSHEVAATAQMPDYVAAAKGNLAWLAWCKGDLIAAERLGKEATMIWRQSPLVYPFQWLALLPLLEVAFSLEKEDETWDYVRALLSTTQQLLPERLNALLEAAVEANRGGDTNEARVQLNLVLEAAKETGYL